MVPFKNVCLCQKELLCRVYGSMSDLYFPHPIHEGYAANCQGKVRNISRGNELKGSQSRSGYVDLNLTSYSDTRKQPIKQHRFVYECFHGSVGKDRHIHHIDANRANNCLINLQSVSLVEHAAETKRHNPKKHALSAQTRKVPIVCFSAEKPPRVFECVLDAAKAMECSCSSIYKCLAGTSQRFMGLVWEYFEHPDEDGEVWASLHRNELRPLQVSSRGRIRMCHRTLRGSPHNGYLRIGYLGKMYMAHALVCEAFHGAKPAWGMSVDHIDRNPTNNSAENLRWSTAREQAQNTSYAIPCTGTHIISSEKRKWSSVASMCQDLSCKRPHLQQLQSGMMVGGFAIEIERN